MYMLMPTYIYMYVYVYVYVQVLHVDVALDS